MKDERSILLIHPSLHARKALENESFARFQPLGLAYISASTPPGWKIQLIDESLEDVKNLEKYAIVGISTNTRTALRAYQLAKEARSRGCYTVVGGIHASMCPEEALEYFDTVIRGEGENLWRLFLEDYKNSSPKRIYKTSIFEDLNNITPPDRSIFQDNYSVASIQTSRGCPFNCSFCSVTAFNGRRYRYRAPDKVLKELMEIKQRYVFFVDDNLIGCSYKSIARAKEIFRGMIRTRISKKFIAQVTINFGENDELLDLAQRSGCRGVFIGIESVETNVLEAMNKAINIKVGVDNYRKIFRNIQKHGIAVTATITLGNDDEPDDIFEETAEFVEKSGVDAVQLTISTPLPGTRLFEQLSNEKRIVFNDFPKDWVHYSLSSLVYIPKQRSAEELIKDWKKLIDSVYSPPRMIRRSISALTHTKSLASAYFAYKLNRAYRSGYRSSLFYSSPPLEKFHHSR